MLPSIGLDAVRPWELDDAPALLAAWSDPDIARWNGVPPDPDLDQAVRWISGATRQTTRSRSVDVVSVNGGMVTGEVGLVIDHTHQRAEVGFWVAPDHRRTGVGRRLLDAATVLAPALGIRQAFAITDSANAASIGLLTAASWAGVQTTSPDRRAFIAPTPTR